MRCYLGSYYFKADPKRTPHFVELTGKDYWDVLFNWAGKLACKGIVCDKVKRIDLKQISTFENTDGQWVLSALGLH